MRVIMEGLTATVLGDYLAQVGLAYLVTTQADPAARFGWDGSRLWLDSDVNVVDFLMDEYQPSPILSPWNRSSGFSAGGGNPVAVLKSIADSSASRLQGFNKALEIARRTEEESLEHKWSKERLALELRNRLPDIALDWLDAAIVLPVGHKASFPPLLGSGGNDGRLEFSAKFHERLVDVLPELGSKRPVSEGWLRDLFEGTTDTKLVRAPVGMYDSGSAGGPGSSKFDTGDSQVNPWTFVLMMEGISRFAAGVSRRLGRSGGRAAMPFTFSGGVGGGSPDVAEANARGEFWAPIVLDIHWSEFARLIAQSRASWDGQRARSAVQMYAATRSFGVERGIARFHRFSFNQAFGLAYVAVLVDVVDVAVAPSVGLARRPLRRLGYLRQVSGAAATERHRRLERSAAAFVRNTQPRELLTLLADLTRAELVAQRTAEGASAVASAFDLPSAEAVLDFLRPIIDRHAEVRVAAGLASAELAVAVGGPVALRSVPLRHLLVGSNEHASIVPGADSRPVSAVIADVLVWGTNHPSEQGDTQGHTLIARHGYRASWQDAHAWASAAACGSVPFDGNLLREAFLAFLALDWRGISVRDLHRRPTIVLLPEVTCLSALLHRRVVTYASTPQAPQWQGIEMAWPSQLRAGKVTEVSRDAVAFLNRSYLPSSWSGLNSNRRYESRNPVRVAPFEPVCLDGVAVLAAAAVSVPPRYQLSTPVPVASLDLTLEGARE